MAQCPPSPKYATGCTINEKLGFSTEQRSDPDQADPTTKPQALKTPQQSPKTPQQSPQDIHNKAVTKLGTLSLEYEHADILFVWNQNECCFKNHLLCSPDWSVTNIPLSREIKLRGVFMGGRWQS